MHETTKTNHHPLRTGEKNVYPILIIVKNHLPTTRVPKERLIVSRGNSKISLPTKKIAFIYSETKMKFAVGFNSNRYFTESPLNDLEPELDKKMFFRLSRWIIVNVNAVRDFQTVEHSKMQVNLVKNRYISEPVIVSQVTAPLFRSWINSL